jgi:hypothetical protein
MRVSRVRATGYCWAFLQSHMSLLHFRAVQHLQANTIMRYPGCEPLLDLLKPHLPLLHLRAVQHLQANTIMRYPGCEPLLGLLKPHLPLLHLRAVQHLQANTVMRVSRVRTSPGPPSAAPAIPAPQSSAAPASKHSNEGYRWRATTGPPTARPATPAPQSGAAPASKHTIMGIQGASFSLCLLKQLLRGVSRKDNRYCNHQEALQKPDCKTLMCTKSP